MPQDAVLYMATLREFGSVGENNVALELTLDPRFKPSHLDLLLEEQHHKKFNKNVQNPLVLLSLARTSTDTILVLCSLRSLGWTLVTSNALVANRDEFHRLFYFEQKLHLDDITGKIVASSHPTGSEANTSNATVSLDSAMDERNKARSTATTSHHHVGPHHPTKTKPMSVFKQLAAKRMSGATPAKTTPPETDFPAVTPSNLATNTTTPTSTPTPAIPAAATSIIKDDEEEEGNDDFFIKEVEAPEKRSSVSMLFSDSPAKEDNFSESSVSTPSVTSATSSSSSINNTSSSINTSINTSSSINSSSSTSSSVGKGPPPVTGAGGRKQPGRLSTLQLNVGKDFNPAMLAGAKPKSGGEGALGE
jgi:hypothetical protein